MHSVLTRRRTLCQPSFFRWKCYRLPSLPPGCTPMHILCFPFRQACSPRRLHTQRTHRPPPGLCSHHSCCLLLQTQHQVLSCARRALSLQRGFHGDVVPPPPVFAETLWALCSPTEKDQRPGPIPPQLGNRTIGGCWKTFDPLGGGWWLKIAK